MLALFAITVAAAASLATASTLTPPVLPLIVRNPYLSTWLQDARDVPWSKWPIFYTGQSIGFSVLASVPSTSTPTVYPLLGRAHDALNSTSTHYNLSFPTYLGANYDASTTNLSYSIASSTQDTQGSSSGSSSFVELTLSFLSPITPTSTLRQGIPASYFTIYVKGDVEVDVYVDVNGQWVSGHRDAEIVWEYEESQSDSEHKDEVEVEDDSTNTKTKKSGLKTFIVKRKHELLFTETRDRAEWGELHFTGPADARHECGTSGDLRQRFAKNGTLRNKVDDDFRRIMDDEPVFAFSKHFNLGSHSNSSSSSSEESSILFTIAHLQDPVTQFASARGLTFMRPLWKSYFPTNNTALTTFHYHDFASAFTLAANYSLQLTLDAHASDGANYADIVALSARQVMGSTSFSGTPENPILFLKEISSNGNSQTIDVIFPAFPFFLYTNPRWLAYLLEPLIEHMGSGQYPNDYAMHDLGTHFPNLTGHPEGRDEYMPVEECGDILIMGLAVVQSLIHGQLGVGGEKMGSWWSGVGREKDFAGIDALAEGVSPFSLPARLETRDGVSGLDDRWAGSTSHHKARKWLSRSYGLWKQWTGYLVEFSLYPENQLCTDDFAGWLKLQTNLALKGIIGIKAMSQLSELMGEADDAKFYRNVSQSYVKRWEVEGMSRDGGRAKLAYHWFGSWTTLYSLFADAVLCFHAHGSESNSSSDTTSTPPPPLLMAGDNQQQPLASTHPSNSNFSSNFIPHHIYTTQSNWYTNVLQTYGLPLDSRHLYTKSDWEFQAAAVASPSTRREIVDRVAKWLNETVADRPFTDLYKTEGDGGFPGPKFFARPVVGSHFGLLVLGRVCGGGVRSVFGG